MTFIFEIILCTQGSKDHSHCCCPVRQKIAASGEATLLFLDNYH